MMLARGTNKNGGELLVLGLTSENVRRLAAGMPMHISQETHGEGVPKGWEILIIHGPDEAWLQRKLTEEGAVGPETKVNVDPRLRNL